MWLPAELALGTGNSRQLLILSEFLSGDKEKKIWLQTSRGTKPLTHPVFSFDFSGP